MFSVIILAAGIGRRMGKGAPKILRLVAGRELLAHTIVAASKAGAKEIIIVLPPNMEEAAQLARQYNPAVKIAIQRKPKGTGDALAVALPHLANRQNPAVVLYGDTPLVLPATIKKLARKASKERSVVFAGFHTAAPKGYGRLRMATRHHLVMIEEDDGGRVFPADSLCNAGFMALIPSLHGRLVQRIAPDGKTGEIYLTALAAVSSRADNPARVIVCGEDEAAGANDMEGLARLESLMQARLRKTFLRAGVQLVAPETCFFSADTSITAGAVIEPYVIIGAGVRIGAGVHIRAFSYLEGAVVGKQASIGPYARIRPQTHIGERARIGNFVEVKQAEVGAEVKASHLAYLGDVSIGAASNIGAGAIVCNYDGKTKHKTEIGADVFIGSNAVLVAPVKIGKGAYVAAGSAISDDVPAGKLAIGRARQVHKSDKR